MKKIVLIISLVMVSAGVFGQDFDQLFDESAVEINFQYKFHPHYQIDGEFHNEMFHAGTLGFGLRFPRFEWDFLNFHFTTSERYKFAFSVFGFSYRLRKPGKRLTPMVSASLLEFVMAGAFKEGQKYAIQNSGAIGFSYYLTEMILFNCHVGASYGTAIGFSPFVSAGISVEAFKL